MRTGTRLRRTIALATAGGLAALIAALPAGPAQASDVVGQLQTAAGTAANSAPCTKTGSVSPTSTAPFANGSAIGASSLSVEWTANADSTDKVDIDGSMVTEASVTTSHGGLHTFSLSGKSTLQVSKTKGDASLCNAVVGQLQAVTEFLFTAPTNGWLYFTRNQPKHFLSEAIITSEDGTSPLYDLYAGPRSKQTIRVFLPRADYDLVAALVQGTGNAVFTKSFQTSSLSGVFRAAGSALGPARGSGTPYVGFPGSVSCAHHSATLTWSGKAGQVRSAVFSVNGAQKKSVKNPTSGGHVVLKNLTASADAHITAALLMKSGATTSATRTYLACTK